MSESERTPLLSEASSSNHPPSDASLESTPLLAKADNAPRYDGQGTLPEEEDSSRPGDTASIASSRKSSRRWPSIIAIIILALASVAIIVVAFFVPAAVEEYAKEAAVLEPTNLSLESITTKGIRARVQANFRLDGSRVKNEHVRRVGRLSTWLVRQLGTDETKVSVYLPDYGHVLLGEAAIPPLVINIMDGHNTAVDFVADLVPGEAEGIRTIANEWLDGKLDQLRIRGIADIQLKSGVIPLGTHTVSESLLFEAKKLPQVPEYNITRLNFQEVPLPGSEKRAMAADVTLSAFNRYPLSLDVPGLGFEILIPNCATTDPYIVVADAVTNPVAVRPQSEVEINVRGLIQELPESLTTVCPDSNSSPLDDFLRQYVRGEPATVFVRGQKRSGDAPEWLGEIISSIMVPVPFPGRTFDDLIRSFELSDVHFTLPDPLAEPDDPEAQPMVSATVLVTAGLPAEMNFDISVTRIRASSDVFYRGDKLGELSLQTWQPANSTRTLPTKDHEAILTIQSRMDDVPLHVTDEDVFTDVVQALIFGGRTVNLDVNALVDVRVKTVLGRFELRGVPAKGKVPVKPLPRGSLGNLAPQVGSIRVLDTTYTSILLQARVNITNPTAYTAFVPAFSIQILGNNSVLGEARAQNLNLKAGHNTNLLVEATWNPSLGGDEGVEVGRNLLSQYLSGQNTTVTLRTYALSFPSQPRLGEALSRLNITVDTPRLRLPGGEDGEDGDDGDDAAHFIRDAIFHVFSSTAAFTLASPLEQNTIYIENINATAFYNHTERVGVITYDLPFAAPPGLSQTPKLPVDWSMGSVGFDKLKKAMGGELRLDAQANVSVRLGNWKERVWYEGRGIGASVRP